MKHNHDIPDFIVFAFCAFILIGVVGFAGSCDSFGSDSIMLWAVILSCITAILHAAFAWKRTKTPLKWDKTTFNLYKKYLLHIPGILLGVTILLSINIIFDDSKATEQYFWVQDKYQGSVIFPSRPETCSKTYCHYSIKNPFPLFFTVSDAENIKVVVKDYNNIVAGKTKVAMKIHAGFLGIPWYEEHFLLYDLKETENKEQ